jgi:hypothetical protein
MLTGKPLFPGEGEVDQINKIFKVCVIVCVCVCVRMYVSVWCVRTYVCVRVCVCCIHICVRERKEERDFFAQFTPVLVVIFMLVKLKRALTNDCLHQTLC